MVYNGRLYTVNAAFEQAEALAVKDGKLVAIGSTPVIREKYTAARELDLQEQPVYPSFINPLFGRLTPTSKKRTGAAWNPVNSPILWF